MAGRSGLLSDLLEFLQIHSPIGGRRHFDQMTEKTRNVKTGETGLSHSTPLELPNFLARPLVAVLFRDAGAVRAFRSFKCLFGQRRRKLINFDPGRSIMKLRNNTDAFRTGRGEKVETAKLINLILIMLRVPVVRA